MYLFGEKMVGNITEDKNIYMKNDKIFYSNNGHNFKSCKIPKENLFEGYLEEFYTYATIDEYVKSKISKELRDFLHNNRLYFYIKINKENKVLEKKIIQYNQFIDKKLVKPYETILPMPINLEKNEATFRINDEDGLYVGIFDKKPSNKFKYIYVSSISFPNMIYHKKTKQYVFDNIEVLSYEKSHI